MSFKVGDWVITSEDCYHPNAKGFIVEAGYVGCRVANKKELSQHYYNERTGDFDLWINNNDLRYYNKEQQLEFNFE